MNHVREPLQSILNELRDGMAALERSAQPKRTAMSNDPYDMTVAEERAQQVDEQIDRLLAENDRLQSQIVDLETALEKIADIAGDHGDGAPDSHPLAIVMLELEALAKDALDEMRGTHRKALEAMQKEATAMSDTLSNAGQGPVNELMAALAAAQAEMSNAPFNQTNPHFKSKYADLASIRDATIPHLAKHGLSIHQVTKMTNSLGMLLVTRLAHASGQWIVSEYPLPFSDKPHIMGSAITYARRYSWAAITGIAAEEDDDANAAKNGAENGTPTNPFFPKRKSSAQAKRDGDWATLEKALKDCQSAREVERLREEWVRDWYPAWKDDWRDAATEAFDKRLAEFSQPGSLKETLQDSIKATDEQDAKFHECWEWLENASTLTELVMRADNAGFREGLKSLTKDQVSQLRAFKAARMEALSEAQGK